MVKRKAVKSSSGGRTPQRQKKSIARFRTEDGNLLEFDAAADENEEEDRFGDLFAANDDDNDDDDDDEIIDNDSDSSSEDDEESEESDDENEVDELDELEEDEGLMRWGSSLYGGDTADLEIGQEVADAEEEEALGEKIRRRQLEALDASDFALEGEEEQDPKHIMMDDGLYGEMLTALNGGTISNKKKKNLTSNKSLLVYLRSAVAQIHKLAPLLDTAAKLKDDHLRPARLVAVLKQQLLLSICLNLGFTSLLSSQDKDPAEHPVVARLASLRQRLHGLDSLEHLEQVFSAPVKLYKATPKAQYSSSEEIRDEDKNNHVLASPTMSKEVSSDEDMDSEEEDAAFEMMPINSTAEKLDAKLMKQARRATRPAPSSIQLTGETDVNAGYFDDEDEDEDDEDEEDDENDEYEDNQPMSMADDELKFLEAYEAQANAKHKQKAEKSAKYTVQQRYGEWTAESSMPMLAKDGHRAATREIVENRGLAPRKPKQNRNPRLKRRLKFRKALIRRKGQVRDTIPEGTDTVNYGGEVTGIRAKISRSRRLLATKSSK